MAQLFMKHVWHRPVYPGLSIQLRTAKMVFRLTLPAREVALSHFLFTKTNTQLQSTHMFCSSAGPATNAVDTKSFIAIYKFPGIRYCRAVSRLKLMQTSLTVLLLPPIYYYYLQGQISQSSLVYFTGTALFAGSMLYFLSYYLRRIIGIIYVDEKFTTLKVSYLTFWGNRRNVFVPVEDVKKLSETGDSRREIILQFARYSSPNILYFTPRYGQILDRDKFTLIFGEIK